MQVKVLTTNEPEAQIKEHHYFEELPPRIQKAIEDSYTGVNLVYEYDKENLEKFFKEVGVSVRL